MTEMMLLEAVVDISDSIAGGEASLPSSLFLACLVARLGEQE
jgi:hypothetical protein